MPRRTKMTLEKQVKVEIRKILEAAHIWYYMPPASLYGKRGIPDFACCIHGRFVGIEAKSPKVGIKGLSPLQTRQSIGIMKNGGEYIVVWDEISLEKLKNRLWVLSPETKRSDLV